MRLWASDQQQPQARAASILHSSPMAEMELESSSPTAESDSDDMDRLDSSPIGELDFSEMDRMISNPQAEMDSRPLNAMEYTFVQLAGLSKQQSAPQGAERELVTWLSECCLLDNVPFHYLIPTESMLPPNSIRLFYVNPDWQLALVDGACSLGRNGSMDLAHDRQLIDTVFAQIGKQMKAIRPLLQHKQVDPQQLGDRVDVIGGFILRSPLVRGWRGLEFQALSADDQVLRALRIETLSDELLIGLFDGVPYKLELAQPPEGFHFGFSAMNGQYRKRMRHLDTGALLAESETVEVVVSDTKARTIDVCQTAKNIEASLGKTVTSAEFALQMIQTPYIGRIQRVDQSS
ncbi:hypothetical protein [Paenibacillus campi]|uniref:hypothetical protein n=1 Tax=Paenibacillus campi TaxID=3106031 RepID=UPI002AFED719|nr:hypothetical protein [Paenibacillus sp. SGZ-1009]